MCFTFIRLELTALSVCINDYVSRKTKFLQSIEYIVVCMV